MGKAAKVRGTSFEYRVRNWFNMQAGWQSERNPLSGASEQIKETVAKHDVRAWHTAKSIFLQIETKKRGKSKNSKRGQQMEIMREWIEKIDFTKDELLVIGLDRSDLYAVVPTERYFQLLGLTYDITYTKDNTYAGQTQFLFKLVDLQDDLYHIKWECADFCEYYTIFPLERFVVLRETITLEMTLTFADRVMRAMTVDELKNLEQEVGSQTYKDKRLLYQKFEELESGQFINPVAHAQAQFWMGGDAFICICPHCEQPIHRADLSGTQEDE